MNHYVKVLVLITISLLFTRHASSQLRIAPANGVGQDVRRVIQDYPYRFSNLVGALIIEHGQSSDFECNFKVKGAEIAMVSQYSSSEEPIRSWEALMLTTEDFEEARAKFKSLFTELNNLSVSPGSGSYHLKGSFEAPVEEKKFTSVIFLMEKEDESVKKLRVELRMSYEPMEWKIKILVYDRDREDDEE